jgi:hypothetical protein
MRSDKINDEGSEGERELNRLIPSMMWSEDRSGERAYQPKSVDGIYFYRVPLFTFISHFCSLPIKTTVCTDIDMQQSNSQNNLNFIFSSPMSSSFVHPQPTAFPPAQPDDPNSPVLFKHNINLVQTQISTVRSVAHEALNAMCVLHSPPARLVSELSSSFLPPAD